jgi:hypothetical protein
MLYGRQVFRLCVKAVLFGMELAREDGLAERLVTNVERFEALCEALKPEAGEAAARLLAVERVIRAIDHFRFVRGDALPQGPMLAAVRHAALALLECGDDLDPALNTALAGLCAVERRQGEYAQSRPYSCCRVF